MRMATSFYDKYIKPLLPQQSQPNFQEQYVKPQGIQSNMPGQQSAGQGPMLPARAPQGPARPERLEEMSPADQRKYLAEHPEENSENQLVSTPEGVMTERQAQANQEIKQTQNKLNQTFGKLKMGINKEMESKGLGRKLPAPRITSLQAYNIGQELKEKEKKLSPAVEDINRKTAQLERERESLKPSIEKTRIEGERLSSEFGYLSKGAPDLYGNKPYVAGDLANYSMRAEKYNADVQAYNKASAELSAKIEPLELRQHLLHSQFTKVEPELKEFNYKVAKLVLSDITPMKPIAADNKRWEKMLGKDNFKSMRLVGNPEEESRRATAMEAAGSTNVNLAIAGTTAFALPALGGVAVLSTGAALAGGEAVRPFAEKSLKGYKTKLLPSFKLETEGRKIPTREISVPTSELAILGAGLAIGGVAAKGFSRLAKPNAGELNIKQKGVSLFAEKAGKPDVSATASVSKVEFTPIKKLKLFGKEFEYKFKKQEMVLAEKKGVQMAKTIPTTEPIESILIKEMKADLGNRFLIKGNVPKGVKVPKEFEPITQRYAGTTKQPKRKAIPFGGTNINQTTKLDVIIRKHEGSPVSLKLGRMEDYSRYSSEAKAAKKFIESKGAEETVRKFALLERETPQGSLFIGKVRSKFLPKTLKVGIPRKEMINVKGTSNFIVAGIRGAASRKSAGGKVGGRTLQLSKTELKALQKTDSISATADRAMQKINIGIERQVSKSRVKALPAIITSAISRAASKTRAIPISRFKIGVMGKTIERTETKIGTPFKIKTTDLTSTETSVKTSAGLKNMAATLPLANESTGTKVGILNVIKTFTPTSTKIKAAEIQRFAPIKLKFGNAKISGLPPWRPLMSFPFLWGGGKTSDKKLPSTTKGYTPYIKTRGRFVRASSYSMPKSEAIATGADIVDNTTAQSFYVKKTKQKVSSPLFETKYDTGKFYNKGNRYIEKARAKIDTMGEILGIPFEGIKKQKEMRAMGIPLRKKKRRELGIYNFQLKGR